MDDNECLICQDNIGKNKLCYNCVYLYCDNCSLYVKNKCCICNRLYKFQQNNDVHQNELINYNPYFSYLLLLFVYIGFIFHLSMYFYIAYNVFFIPAYTLLKNILVFIFGVNIFTIRNVV